MDANVRRDELVTIFEGVEENRRKLVVPLIDELVYQETELLRLRRIPKETGHVQTNPHNTAMQRTFPAAKAYKELMQTYNNTIKTLNMVLGRNAIEPEDGFDEFMNEE